MSCGSKSKKCVLKKTQNGLNGRGGIPEGGGGDIVCSRSIAQNVTLHHEAYLTKSEAEILPWPILEVCAKSRLVKQCRRLAAHRWRADRWTD